MSDAARRPELLMQPSSAGVLALEEVDGTSDGAWPGEAEQLSLVLDASHFDHIVGEAAAWADRINLCLTAPQSQRGSAAWWQELFARNSKWERVQVRRPEQTEAWLLHRLHETGALSLVEGGGKQVAGNLLMFARSNELRVLLTHIPLERAVAGATFGALLAFRGSGTSEIARSCRAQADSWRRLGRIPTGSEIDALAAARRSEPAPEQTLPTGPLRLVSEPRELEARVERLRSAGLDASALEGGWSAHVRGFDGGVRVEFQHRDKARARVVLTLHAGSAWAAGNALLLETRDGELVLAWRGGLLGHSRSKCELLWSQARLPTFLLEDAALGPAPRVALVARSGAALAPQLGAFVRETCRLGEVFGVEPPPTLGHAVAEFGSLSVKQQALLLWRALLGLGALDFGVATSCAAQALRDQGYVRGSGSESGGLYGAVAELLAQAAEGNPAFDCPGLGKIRAIQPELSAYVLDDWQDCLLQALPENQTVSRRQALRLAFERARSHWGSSGVELVPNGRLERILESTLASTLRRGLFARVGAGGVKRCAPLAPAADLSVAYRGAVGSAEDGLLAGWSRALAQLSQAQRFLLTRRSGWYCRRETLESASQRLGLTLERGRQLELEAWQSIENESDWARTLRERLAQAFAGAGFLPVRLLMAEDPWWRGIDQHPGLAEAVFESLLGGEVKRVELGPPPRRELLFARFSQAELDHALDALLERAGQLPTPALRGDVLGLAGAAAEPLDSGLGEYLRAALEARLELDAAEPTRVLRLLPSAATLEHLPEHQGVDTEGRLRLEDAARSAFRSARTPLSLTGIAERIRQRMDVDEQTLAVLLAHAPFVQRNADQYGLLARDVPGGHEAIASALNAVVETLERKPRLLSLRDAFALMQEQVKQPWSLELVRSLIGSDPALSLSATLDVRLSRWEHARLVAATELVCPGLPAAARPRFEKLNQLAPSDPAELTRQLRAQLARLERSADADEFVVLSLARQLCDVYARLLDHAAQCSAQAQRLAQSAARYFLELTTHDEDELEAPGVDHEQLLETRAVLAAVLVQLELDWLEWSR